MPWHESQLDWNVAVTVTGAVRFESVQTFVGGKTLVDVVHRVFEGTPLADVMGRIAAKSAGNGAWHAAPEADD